MAIIKIHSKNQIDVDKKPRVYFTCHPDDFGRYFQTVCEDLFRTHDCAVYYTEDMSAEIEDKDKDVDLGRKTCLSCLSRTSC